MPVKWFAALVLLLALPLAAGCAAGQNLGVGATVVSSIERSPTPQVEGGIVSSNGATVVLPTRAAAGKTPSPGMIEGGAGSAEPSEGATPSRPEPTANVPMNWLDFSDPTYHFSVKYPDSYLVLPEPNPLPAAAPPVLRRVRFQDKGLASSETADLQPPQFMIEVFSITSGTALRDWLQANHLLPAGAAVEPTRLAASADALHVTLRILLAPNEFYYVASKGYVFRLTPLGASSREMLASFRLN